MDTFLDFMPNALQKQLPRWPLLYVYLGSVCPTLISCTCLTVPWRAYLAAGCLSGCRPSLQFWGSLLLSFCTLHRTNWYQILTFSISYLLFQWLELWSLCSDQTTIAYLNILAWMSNSMVSLNPNRFLLPNLLPTFSFLRTTFAILPEAWVLGIWQLPATWWPPARKGMVLSTGGTGVTTVNEAPILTDLHSTISIPDGENKNHTSNQVRSNVVELGARRK